jgi:hypothetical protein
MRLTLRPEAYELDLNGGSHWRAMLDVSLDRPFVLPAETAKVIVLPSAGVQKVTLSMASTSAQTLLQSWFAPSVWSEWIDAQTVEGFRDLMSSRFKQFFAFPDLANYDKRAPFWFALSTTSKPTLQCSSAGLDLGFPMASWLLLQDETREIGYKPLVNFTAPTQLLIGLPKISSDRKTRASISSMSLRAQFDARYISEENPNTIIAIDTIESSVREAAEEILAAPEKIEGGLGEVVQILNRTDITCGSTEQMLRISF